MWIPGFAADVSRGLLRDRRTRQRMMFGAIAVALFLAVSGATIMRSMLNPHEHLALFIFHWLACAWVTILALLLAVLDLLIVRMEAREAKKNLARQFATPDSPSFPERQ